MADILPFKKPAKKKAANKSLCRHGFHKWVVAKDTTFDSKQGRLVTLYRCQRCGKTKIEAR